MNERLCRCMLAGPFYFMEYLGMRKAGLIKRLAVKLAHVNCGF